MLLGEVTGTIRRFDDGNWTSGDYARGAPVADLPVVGSLQPDGDTIADPLERGSRKVGAFVFIVELEGQPEVMIVNLAAVTEGDRLLVNGVTYIVTKVQEWLSHQQGLPHRRFIVQRKGADE